MTLLALATWASIGVLVVGSVLVFAWFLADVRSVLHEEGPKGGEEE